jgi:hypothetical protein
MKADSVTSVSLPRIDIKYSSLSSFWLPDRARVQFINYGEMQAQPALYRPQADDTPRGNEGASWANFREKMAAAGGLAAAALQEDTPLKKHRLVLFSVSDSKDAPF